MKFISNHTRVKIYNKWQVIFHEYAALNIIYFVATPLLGTWLRAVESLIRFCTILTTLVLSYTKPTWIIVKCFLALKYIFTYFLFQI